MQGGISHVPYYHYFMGTVYLRVEGAGQPRPRSMVFGGMGTWLGVGPRYERAEVCAAGACSLPVCGDVPHTRRAGEVGQ